MTSPKTRSFLAGFALTAICAAGPATARDADVAALEARVAELEALVQQLIEAQADAQPEAEPAPAPVAEQTDADAVPMHSYKFGGYVKFDSLTSWYSDGDLAPGSPGTQFYIPATIPVGDAPSSGPDTDFQARATRINFTSNHNLDSGAEIKTLVEFDFFLSPGGNERVSNSYNPRLRHAYFTYNNWLFGQNWSTFQDVGALPEAVDFIGPSESTTFIRQPQVRYTSGAWEFAVENPETTITPFGGGSRIVTDDGPWPDLVGRYTAQLDNGYIKAAALLRQLNYEAGGVKDEELAYGVSVSGKHNFGQDDLRWMATVGTGVGRYLGLNTSNGAVLDAEGKLEAIDQWGAFASFRHFWSDQWRSNFILGYLSIDNDTALTGTGVTSDVYSVHANLLYSPVPKMTVGAELMFAEREVESGDQGDMTRFLLSAKYIF